MNTAHFVLIAAILMATASPAAAQRNELDGGNSGTVTLGPSETEIGREIGGDLTVDLHREGIGVEAGGALGLDLDGQSETVSRSLSIGETRDMGTSTPPPSNSSSGSSGNGTSGEDSPAATPEGPEAGAVPNAGAAATSVQATDDTAETCPDADGIAALRAAFLDQAEPESLAYIRRIDIPDCGHPADPDLALRLNTLPNIQPGLTHMDTRMSDILWARWTDDKGLILYTRAD